MSEHDPRPSGEAEARETSTADRRSPDATQSLEDLVAGVFGETVRPGRPSRPDDTVMVPPAPGRRAATAGGPPPPEAGAAEAGAPRRRSLLRRLQVSPAVIVASLIAGATGAAADAWFDELAGFVGLLASGHEEVSASPVVDVPPADVEPSDFSAEEAVPAPADATPVPAAGAPPVPSPVPAADAPAAPAQPAEAPLAATPADRVRLITWDEGADGTVVTFWGNGAFLPERIVRVRVAGGRPRELVKLRGIDVPFPQTALELGTPEVTRVRTGFHPQRRVNELHVVLDLAAPGVTLERTEPVGDRLLLHLRRPAAASPPSGSVARGPTETRPEAAVQR